MAQNVEEKKVNYIRTYALDALLEIAAKDYICRGIILENAVNKKSFVFLSKLAAKDEYAKEEIAKLAKEGRIPAIEDLPKTPVDKDFEDAEEMLLDLANEGMSNAYEWLATFAYWGDEKSLDALLKFSLDRSEPKDDAEYRIVFAIRQLLRIIWNNMQTKDLSKETINKIIDKFHEIGRSGDYEAFGLLRSELQRLGSYVYTMAIEYPNLEPLVTFLIGKRHEGMSIYDQHYHDKPSVTHVTNFTYFPERKRP